MRNAARLVLALALVLVGWMALPRPAPDVARAQIDLPKPSPTVPDPRDLLKPPPDPAPKPPPEPEPAPPPPDGGGGGRGTGDTGGDPSGGGSGGTTPDPVTDTRSPERTSPAAGQARQDEAGRAKDAVPGAGAFVGTYRITGNFSTDKLVAVATRLRSLGWSGHALTRKVYTPFIIGGPAGWTDTWGAPRYGPAPGQMRSHEGQDVFCKYGDPVLAAERGTVEFDNQGLGGRVARLHRSDGSYWYYAHLSGFNRAYSSGDPVRAGDVIGYCGNTGNALTTPPHVHFGWYEPDGTARNPMRMLVTWLRTAEARAGVLEVRTARRRVRAIESITAARRFGDDFAPDLSRFETRSEAALAAPANPASGAFGLAEAALQAALARSLTEEGFAGGEEELAGGEDVSVTTEGAGVGLIDPDSRLGRLLSQRRDASAESGD